MKKPKKPREWWVGISQWGGAVNVHWTKEACEQTSEFPLSEIFKVREVLPPRRRGGAKK